MGTRSYIGKKMADGKIRAIYCHWDGYPSHNGAILLRAYQDATKVDQLLDLGSLSVLGDEIGEKHDFDSDQPKSRCTAYGRDRGEDDVDAIVYDDERAFVKGANESGAEFVYLFVDGEWRVGVYDGVLGFVKLTEAIVAE